LNILDSIFLPSDVKKLDYERLNILSQELREFLINNVSVTGGHLAANLGVVELTLSLLYVFDFPKDKIVWDVGHQSYVYKILTGRKDRFGTLRQYGGISGFPKSKESIFDCFDTGHSSTSISVALGFAIARDFKKEDSNVIAVIGDGALTGGLAYEGLNNAGRYDGKLMVILNDNQMSISKNVGAIAKYLTTIRLNKEYFKFKDIFDTTISKIPYYGDKINKLVDRLKGSVKYFLLPGIFFEALGFEYYGPFDGHDIKKLIDVFSNVKKINKPILIHVLTQKGKGYEHAEKYPDKYHGVPPFDIETGNHFSNYKNKTYSQVLGETLLKLAEKDERIVAITAAMPDGTGLKEFSIKYPNRFFDVGIAEEHAVTFAAALAKEGLKPYVAIYSTFLQRSFDQIIHDVCLQNLGVVFCIDRAGIVGEDGETHHGAFDLSYLSLIPNITIMAPKDTYEFGKMIEFSLFFNQPLAIRYPRGWNKPVPYCYDVVYGKLEQILKGKKGVIIAIGRHVGIAYEIVKKRQLDWSLINLRFIKPIDPELTDILKEYKKIIIIEDNTMIGGIGQQIKSMMIENNITANVLHLSLPDQFLPHGNILEIDKLTNLDYESIERHVLEMDGH